MIEIPDAFLDVAYDGSQFPGAHGAKGLERGANCQHFAYELLRHNGFAIGNLRSSDLWEDTRDTVQVAGGPNMPGDLLLFNRAWQAWGAHIALYLGEDRAVHLSKRVGRPMIWTLAEFAADPLYAHFIGAKRPIRRAAAQRP